MLFRSPPIRPCQSRIFLGHEIGPANGYAVLVLRRLSLLIQPKKARHFELPKKEAPFIRHLLLHLCFGRAHAVTRGVVHAKKNWAAGCRGLQSCGHFSRLP